MHSTRRIKTANKSIPIPSTPRVVHWACTGKIMSLALKPAHATVKA